MKTVFLVLLGMVAHLSGQELKLFAPAVKFSGVKWWGPSQSGLMTWTDGLDQTVYPANVGEIKEGRLDKTQEIVWRRGSYQILSVERTDTGAIAVRFEKGALLMTRTHDGYFTVDVFPPEAKAPTDRFRTTMKSTAHDDFIDPPRR